MKLRRNHVRSNSSLGKPKMILFVIILITLLIFIYRGLISFNEKTFEGYELNIDTSPDPVNTSFLPSSAGEIVHHQEYALSYIEAHEQAEWVCYKLTEEMLKKPNVPRAKRFEEDPNVSSKSANYYDYRGSGYTRGHLVPAGDMAHSVLAMEETFFMSNISPQIRPFNNGVWKELEEQVRDWVYHNDQLYICSGPVLNQRLGRSIGKSKVSVPEYFYKAIISVATGKEKGIAFLIPHQKCIEPLTDFAISIDSLESIVGIDFFEKLNPSLINQLESSVDVSKWKFSDARYKLRVERWNNE